MTKVAIIGAGAWGTALAMAVFRAGCEVIIWTPSLDEAETINQRHENVYRLPGIALDSGIKATMAPERITSSDMIIFVSPAQKLRDACQNLQGFIQESAEIIIASKGIEIDTNLLMVEIARSFFPKNPMNVLSGPSFAHDVARKLPTAVIVASETLKKGQHISKILGSETFRLYASDDLIGVQIGGACKNIVAIACGIIEGRNLGDNAKATIITYGLAEIARLGCAMGARMETFLGLAGVGDITLTSLNSQSRNMSFGVTLGRGTAIDKVLANKKYLTEGIYTISAALQLAKNYSVEMPITSAMNELINNNGNIETLIERFFIRSIESTLI